jgi:cell division protein FtsW
MGGARRTIFIVVGALLSVGVVMVYSASYVVAAKKYGSPTFLLERHAIYLLLGCMALAVTSLFDYHKLARYWKWCVGLALLLLALVLVPGVGQKYNGARRWFAIGSLTVQPSEAVKLLMIVGIAGWIAHTREQIATAKGFTISALMVSAAVVLTAMEPDLGSAGLLAVTLSSLLFVAGIRLRYAIPAFLISLPLGALFAYSKLGYIRGRVEQWLNGADDVLGKGYQVDQGMKALGSGGLFGSGLGQGNAKLLYLPEVHNDFIFAQIGEELGLIGTLSVLALFALFVIQGWRVARRAPDMLGSLLALGVTLCIGFQAAINIAVVTHSMPTKGISLPFISYGGSSLIFTLAAIGLLLNVAAHPACDSIPPPTLGAIPRNKSSGQLQSLVG